MNENGKLRSWLIWCWQNIKKNHFKNIIKRILWPTGWWWRGACVSKVEFNGVSHCESLINFPLLHWEKFQKYFETFDEILRDIWEIYLILMKFLGRNVICEMKINEGREKRGGWVTTTTEEEKRDYLYHFHLLAI